MVQYIKSDLQFILDQIKIAEAHAAGQPLFGPGGLIPAYNLSLGLRTVDGSYNHLLPGQEQWGAAEQQFPHLLDPAYRPADGTLFDPDGGGPAPAMPTAQNYNPSNNPNSLVFDQSLRTISNLLVDQTLGNPAAVLTALQRAGSANEMADLTAVTAIYQTFKPASDAEYQARVVMQNARAAADALGDGDPLTPPTAEEQEAIDAWMVARDAYLVTLADLEVARDVRDLALEPFGIAMDGDNVHLPAVAPDEGLSAPFNSWFTLFGQFFDHGLDLVNKGGSGTVFIPLAPDDPLYVEGSHTNFMVLTRATVSAGPDLQMGTADDVGPVNTTTSYVDQNQTYTSHPSHQVFLRQYVLNAAGDPVATGKLIEGGNGGMATWGEVKAQAAEMLGILLTDADVGAVPLLRTDPYGNFIPDLATGMPQIILGVGTDGIPNTADDVVRVGDLAAPVSTEGAIRIPHAFLADIAHEAVPIGKIADGDITIGLANPGNGDEEYDNELLDAHFIAGDGRANENIGLTAVHHVFHAEHNRLVQHTKDAVLATDDLAFINQWLVTPLAGLPTPEQVPNLVWDGERLFQAAKFGTEMQYQHLVFEEFARKVQPNINVFLVPDGFDTTMDPSIVAEFAHVVYRFGHSMLTESIDRFDPNFTADHIGLIEGFLNPVQFDAEHAITDDVAAGAIIRGMTRQVGNEIDEFVTTALRNNLLGLPLDLATINLARGRDTGVPSLNAARREFYAATNQDILLKPYESWVDYAGHLKHEASIINFIAAYGTHSLITTQTTLQGKRDAALTLITGTSYGGLAVQADAEDFLNGLNAYASNLGGLENVDLWIGGLAEEIMPFGGMLGSTFNFVFEVQMEKLQSGDRFYYLQRLDGLHLFGEMENNSFAAMIMRNTDATHLPSDVFSTPGLILEVNQARQFNDLDGDGTLENDDPAGGGLLTPLVVRNNPATIGPDTNYLKYTGDEHVVLGGTEANDIIIASIGDDTIFGDGGNDQLEGGFGNDIINGGAGDDIIKDSGGDDNIKAGAGHDVVHAGPGLDLVMGNEGQDFIFLGTDMGSEVFAGTGNDFIYGNKNAERILGNEGDDWIETGTFDGAPGDNFDEIYAQDGIDGHDVFLGDGGFDEFIAEGGDDIMVGSFGRGKMAGMSGFDWATYKDMTIRVDADFTRGIVFDENPNPPQFGTLDAYESVEGLSGSKFNDTLTGADTLAEERLPQALGGSEGFRGSFLTKEGVQRIAGLQAVLGLTDAQMAALAATANVYDDGEIILGGDGSDVIMGRAGDDIIDGDKWLNVVINVHASVGVDGGVGQVIGTYKSMTELAAQMFNGTINPGQLRIHREITTAGADAIADIDVARYQGLRGEYAFSATADGQVIVSHAVEDSLDGTDKLRNIERIQFSDNTQVGIVVGTPYNDNGLAPQGAPPQNQPALNGSSGDDLILGLAGSDILNGLGGNDILVGGPGSNIGTYLDNFDGATSYADNNGSLSFNGAWFETNDTGGTGGAGGGDIEINGSRLRFDENINGNEIITRNLNLTGVTAATLRFDYEDMGLDVGSTGAPVENVHLEIYNGSGWDLAGTFGGNTPTGTNFFIHTFTAAQIRSDAAIRFRAEGDWESGENFFIDNVLITVTNPTLNAGSDTLNGGAGDDTYSFTLGDGNDTINEGAAGANSGGSADQISILAPQTGVDLDGLPVFALNALNAFDNNGGTNNGDLVITYGMPAGAGPQTITVAGHFTGAGAANDQVGVERINFNGASYAGYLLGSTDYLIGRLDPANRDAGGVNLSASAANNFIVGENGTSDVITGGSGNDLIFGGSGNNNLVGGLGDDLIVGGGNGDALDSRNNGDQDALDFVGALGADTLVGGGGNDTYGVDDLADVVVELAGEGDADLVETFMAELSIETFANVENLTYRGGDADQFVGTGNSGNNVITGGDLADTLSGLAGNDELDGGLGADTLIGGDGSDTYIVDDVGDVVTETNAALATGGNDTVESSVDFTLGANVENLNLDGAAVVGIGNALNNIINGTGGDNQLFGGVGDDTLNGDDGDDLLDGGDGIDTINGGDDDDIIIGGSGNDIINVGGGFNRLVYNTANFGNDIVNSFDPTGGSATTQDLIDLSAFGLTAANIGTTTASRIQVENVAEAGTDDTRITVRDASGAVMGTIYLEDVENAITASDFILATAPLPANTITGTNASQTLTGIGNTSETFNALGGNDIVNANGGNDVVNGGEGADTLNGGDGNDTLNGGTGIPTGTHADDFAAAGSYTNNTGTLNFASNWTETGDNNSAASGDFLVTAGVLRFTGTVDSGDFVQRSINLAGATAPTLAFTYQGLANGESVAVEAFNGSTWDLLTTLGGTTSGTQAPLPLNAAHTAIRFRATSNFDGGETFNIDNVVVALGPNSGADTINGDAGDDTINWNANAVAGPTDGFDIVNGGTEGALGDTFVITGNASAETYRIYTKAAAATAGFASAAATEIVITRQLVAGAEVKIAELSEIEEIRINGADPSSATTGAGGDTFQIIGDFSGTSLRPNTITIDGDAGDDVIDISSLGSAHRIVFKSNGGNDTIIGDLRAEDVIELVDGDAAAYELTDNGDGTKTVSNGTHSVTFTGAVPPQFDTEEPGEEEPEEEEPTEEPEEEEPTAPTPGAVRLGTVDADVLNGTTGDDSIVALGGDDVALGDAGADAISAGEGADFVSGGAGRDIVFAGAGDDQVFGGADADIIYGDAGADRIFGDEGNDLITAGAGNDTAFGGAGNDMFVAEIDDGNDTYFGDGSEGGSGNDTLDMSAASAAVTVNLGSGALSRGSASSSQTGSDTLWGIENVNTGSGNDTIVASNAANVMDGGAGNDTFKFTTTAAADGDTITGFEPGDRIDLSEIDANTGAAGNQNFTLISGAAFTAAGQIAISFDGEFTVVEGTVDGNGADFRIEIEGQHTLTDQNFNL